MKAILKVVKWFFIVLLSLLFFILFLLLIDRDAQRVVMTEAENASIKSTLEFDPEVDSSLYFSLLEKYGKNKSLAKGFEYQCLLALSHYPELKEIPIEFQVRPAFLPLASRPDPITVLFPWIKRKYLVVISDESEDFFEPILLKNTPFNEQVGIIGHELAHSVFYLDKNSLQLAKIAYKYETDNPYRIQFERDTDKRAIAHGLGYQMYDFAFFVRKAFGNSRKEIENEEGDMYLSPKEIAKEMEKYDFYRDTLPHPNTFFADE